MLKQSIIEDEFLGIFAKLQEFPANSSSVCINFRGSSADSIIWKLAGKLNTKPRRKRNPYSKPYSKGMPRKRRLLECPID